MEWALKLLLLAPPMDFLSVLPALASLLLPFAKEDRPLHAMHSLKPAQGIVHVMLGRGCSSR